MRRRVFFNKTIILLGLAGYEMIISNSALCAFFGYIPFHIPGVPSRIIPLRINIYDEALLWGVH